MNDQQKMTEQQFRKQTKERGNFIHTGEEERNPKETIDKIKSEYIGCKSWNCQQCKHYVKFLSVSTMQTICWNKGCFYEMNGKT